MQPLIAGKDVSEARKTLNLNATELAAVLGIGVATLRRYESSARLDNMVALAVECLLRRAQPAASASGKSPAEIAARQVAIAAERARLREQAGLTAARYVPLTPEQKAARKLETQLAYKRLCAAQGIPTPAEARSLRKRAKVRNEHRDRERPMIAALHAKAKLLAIAGEWEQYHRLLQSHSIGEGPSANQLAYLEAATKNVLPDDSPLVTLPLEDVP